MENRERPYVRRDCIFYDWRTQEYADQCTNGYKPCRCAGCKDRLTSSQAEKLVALQNACNVIARNALKEIEKYSNIMLRAYEHIEESQKEMSIAVKSLENIATCVAAIKKNTE